MQTKNKLYVLNRWLRPLSEKWTRIFPGISKIKSTNKASNNKHQTGFEIN